MSTMTYKSQLEHDAEYILEEVMHRKRWSAEVREQLAQALGKVAEGKPLRKEHAKRPRNG